MARCEHQGYSNECDLDAGSKICYPCGMPACAGCSHLMIRLRDGRKVRVGIPCIEDHKGEYVLMKPMTRELQISERLLRKHGYTRHTFEKKLRLYGFSTGEIKGGIYDGELKSNAPRKAIEVLLK